MAFLRDFHKVFKEGLEPLGFKRLKGTDFYGRVVNNEILHLVSFKKMRYYKAGCSAFLPQCGAISIYSYAFDEIGFEARGVDLSVFFPLRRKKTYHRVGMCLYII